MKLHPAETRDRRGPNASRAQQGRGASTMFRPVRPAAYLPDVTAIMESAQRAAVAGGSGPFPQRSAFNPIPQSPVVYPTDLGQLQLFNQLGQYLPQGGLQDLQQFTGGGGDSQAASGSRGKGKSSQSDKASSAYASRHQAAEQRRRNRINERCASWSPWPPRDTALRSIQRSIPPSPRYLPRQPPPHCQVAVCRLDKLRSVVPHAERANTASFLEEVIKYVTALQSRVRDLEAVVGPAQHRHPPATPDPLASILPPAPGAQPYAGHPLHSEQAAMRSSLPPPMQLSQQQQQRPSVPPAGDSSPGFRPVANGHKHPTPPPSQHLAASPGLAKRSPTSSTATEDSSGVPPKKRHRSQAVDQAVLEQVA